MIGSFMNDALACDDVEAAHRQLSERGVEFVTPPAKQHCGSFAVFPDPDGNRIVPSQRQERHGRGRIFFFPDAGSFLG
jgi:predicted enzyme related to lactoylglutathione lyase